MIDLDSITEETVPTDHRVAVAAIDLSYVMKAAFYATNKDPQASLRLVLSKVKQWMLQLNTTDFSALVFAADSPPYFRLADTEFYKQDRTDSDSPDEKQAYDLFVKTLAKVLPMLGCRVWKVPEAEADDLLVCIVQHLSPTCDVLLVANDSDLDFLHASHTFSHVGFSGAPIWEPRIEKTYHQMNPHLLPLYLALLGGHNGAINIEKLGPVTARNMVMLVNEYMDPEEALNALLEINPPITKKRNLAPQEAILRMNVRLQLFPYPGFEVGINDVLQMVTDQVTDLSQYEVLPLMPPYTVKQIANLLGVEVPPHVIDAIGSNI